MKARIRSGLQPPVSIVTCTKRHYCLKNLFENYSRQKYPYKELIIILNNKSLKLDDYIKAAKSYKDVRIYQVPEHISLGQCLNYGAELSRHDLIAKFDDDDYYAPDYLSESVRAMLQTNADIVGKRAHYMYLSGKKRLLLRYASMANQYVPMVQGATLLVKRQVFSRVSFPDRNQGECVKFCSDSLAKGFKIYAGSRHNFLAMRRKNSKDHTWIVSDSQLIAKKVKIIKARDAKSFVSRGLK